MKRLSLQWRLTLTAAALVAAACLLLNLFISRFAIMHINEIENYMIEVVPDGQEAFRFDVSGLYPGLQEQIRKSTEAFSVQSGIATLVVILLAGISTYFLTGSALVPLRKLNDGIEKIQAQNLSKPLEEPRTNDEVARLTRSFNRMLERLDNAFARQRRFAANAAHELRTPLAVIRTNLDVLQKRKHPTAEEYADAIQSTSEQTERLSHMVEVLLEMTEPETAPRRDNIYLAALMEEVFCDLTQVAEEKKVTLYQEPGDARVTGSDLLLYRAVYNLAENAIKYNRPGGSVTAGVRAEGGYVLIYMKDTGIGIARENWENIFEPFVRVDKSRSRAMGGAGLGLAMVRDIAKKHGGSVQVVQSSDEGTVIEMRLPALN